MQGMRLKERNHSFQEAMGCLDSNKWLEAMKKEMESLWKNKTWRLAEKQERQKLIDCKWIYKLKEGATIGEELRYKARLVTKAFTQKEGVDYTEIFSPMVKYKTIRFLLAIVAQFNWEFEQMDVKTTFFHGELKEDLYMRQPKGFKGRRWKNMVCKLERSLYNQASSMIME